MRSLLIEATCYALLFPIFFPRDSRLENDEFVRGDLVVVEANGEGGEAGVARLIAHTSMCLCVSHSLEVDTHRHIRHNTHTPSSSRHADTQAGGQAGRQTDRYTDR